MRDPHKVPPLPVPRAERKVRGFSGVPLATQEWGNPDGPPVLLVHGFTQSHLTWLPILSGELARDFRVITLDLRGHGHSGKPDDPSQYNNARPWAEDLAAIIADYGLVRPVVCGWSYGGFVVAGYLSHYGGDALGGVVFDGTFSAFGGEEGAPLVTADFFPLAEKLTSDNLGACIEGTITFAKWLTAKPMDGETFAVVLASNAMTPAYVRAAMLDRQEDLAPALSAYDGPTLVIHGAADHLILPAAAERAKRLLKNATVSIYPDIGHTPHFEAAGRFEADLCAFARENAGRA